jgi:hypothetical protein
LLRYGNGQPAFCSAADAEAGATPRQLPPSTLALQKVNSNCRAAKSFIYYGSA